MRDILKRGIGVHHSGVLPIMKEVCSRGNVADLENLLFLKSNLACEHDVGM